MAKRRKNQKAGNEFFELLPPASLTLFFLGVFFVFAPVNLLLVSSFAEKRSVGTVALAMFISGAVAVCWAATFTLSRKFVVGIVLFSTAIVAAAGPFRLSAIGIGPARPSPEGIGSVVAIVVGYVLFVVFISGQGRTTMRLSTEMRLARRIHEALVPPVHVENGRFEARGLSVPSSAMGGDLIEVLTREGDGSTDLLVADVSGHGVSAGVVMGMVKASIHTHALRRGELADLARDLNDVLEKTTRPEVYATLAGLRIEHATGHVRHVGAGHHHVAHYQAASGQIRRVGGRDFPLGLFGGRRYEARSIEVSSGDLLAIYTDGLNETTNAAGEELGHEVIEREVASLAREPLARIEAAVFERVARHGPQNDDRSLLLVRFR